MIQLAFAVVYATAKAEHLRYDGHPTTRGEAMKAGEALTRGDFPPSGAFVSGYYFNDALLRVDAAYENTLRQWTGLREKKHDADALVEAAHRRGFAKSRLHAWGAVRDEVNDLKHRTREQKKRHVSGKGVSLADVRFHDLRYSSRAT